LHAAAHAADQAVDLVALFQEELGQVASVLSRHTGNESFFIQNEFPQKMMILPPRTPRSPRTAKKIFVVIKKGFVLIFLGDRGGSNGLSLVFDYL
jgi:hypothetical protein